MSTLRLPGLKSPVRSGLTLSGASLPHLQTWGVPLNSRRRLDAAEWVNMGIGEANLFVCGD